MASAADRLLVDLQTQINQIGITLEREPWKWELLRLSQRPLDRLVVLHLSDAPDAMAEIRRLRAMPRQVAKRLTRQIEPGHATKQDYWRKWSNRAHAHERIWAPPIGRFFHEQEARVAASYASRTNLTRAVGDDPPEWWDQGIWNADLGSLLERQMSGTVNDFGVSMVAQLGGSPFNATADPVRSYITGRSTSIAGLVNGTTEAQLRQVVADGEAAGLSISGIADSISAYFNVNGNARAELIARTEVIGAANFATVQAGAQNGATGKEWLASADDRVCPICEDLDGEQVAIDQPFSSGDDAPPEHPDCRCTVLILTAAEFDIAA